MCIYVSFVLIMICNGLWNLWCVIWKVFDLCIFWRLSVGIPRVTHEIRQVFWGTCREHAKAAKVLLQYSQWHMKYSAIITFVFDYFFIFQSYVCKFYSISSRLMLDFEVAKWYSNRKILYYCFRFSQQKHIDKSWCNRFPERVAHVCVHYSETNISKDQFHGNWGCIFWKVQSARIKASCWHS